MKKFVWIDWMLVLVAVLLFAVALTAQTPGPVAAAGRKVAWDQAAPSLAEAQGYTYRLYVDGAAAPILVTSPVTCVNPGTAGAPYVCQTAFPPMTPGPHTLVVTASNDSGESLPSTPFAFQFIVVPVTPRNVRLG